MRFMRTFNRRILFSLAAGIFSVAQVHAAAPQIYAPVSSGVYALDAKGQVWEWQTGGRTGAILTNPEKVSGLSDVAQLGGNGVTGLVIKNDGSVLSWSSRGISSAPTSPQPVTGLPAGAYKAVANISGTTALLDSNGDIWAWGNNYTGQLGQGTSGGSGATSAVVKVKGLTGIQKITGADGTFLALASDGTVWAWGSGGSGQLGNGQNSDQSLPVKVSGLSGVVDILAGSGYSLAVTANGTIYGWGYSYFGKSGTSVPVWAKSHLIASSVPVAIGSMGLVTKLLPGKYGIAGLTADGRLVSVFPSDREIECRSTEAYIGADGVLTMMSNVATASLSPSASNLLAVKTDGTIWTCNNNSASYSSLGLAKFGAYTSDFFNPVLMTDLKTPLSLLAGGGDSSKTFGVQAATNAIASGFNPTIYLNIDSADQGTMGSVFVAVLFGGQAYFATPTGLVQLDPNGTASYEYLSGVLNSSYDLSNLFGGKLDLSAYTGLTLVVGYGKNLNDMLTQKKYKAVFTVPPTIKTNQDY